MVPLLLLLGTPTVAQGVRGPSGTARAGSFGGSTLPRAVAPPDPYSFQLPYGYYEYTPFDNPYSNSIQLHFQVTSSILLDIYVMNQTQFLSFRASGSKSAIYHNTASSAAGTAAIPGASTNYLLVENDVIPATATVQITAWTVPIDVLEGYSASPAPVGIADYGIEDYPGTTLPYEVTSAGVQGIAKISALGAFNSTAPSPIDPDGASLQLNIVLGVNTTKGQYAYWLQDVASFRTSVRTVYFASEIFNFSLHNANLSRSLVTGNGNVYPLPTQPPQPTNTYLFLTPRYSYSLPYYVELLITYTQSAGNVVIKFGYLITENGVPVQGSTVYFDTVTISEPAGVSSSGIVVDGNKLTPDGHFYDAEFVFGGEYNGEHTTFTSMDAILSLSYQTSSGSLVLPRSLYEFGGDTAEAAYNLQTTYTNGNFEVDLGTTSFTRNYLLPGGIIVPLTFSFSLAGGSTSAPGAPTLTYFYGGVQQTVTLTSTPTVYYVDNNTAWSVSSTFSGTSSDRWATSGTVGGTVAIPRTFSFVYYHQYLYTLSYSVTGGGAPAAPSLGSTQFGVTYTQTISSAATGYWLDSGAACTFTNPAGSSTTTERWYASASCPVASSPQTIVFDYYHQYSVTASYVTMGGGSPGAPVLSYVSLGATQSAQLTATGQSLWVDSGSSYSATNPLLGSSSTERWFAPASAGTATSAGAVALTFYHQFSMGFQYSVIGGGSPGSPTLSATAFGTALTQTLATTQTTLWLDAGNAYSITALLPASSSTERWFAADGTTGTVSSSTLVAPTYNHQYPFSASGAGSQLEWFNAGSTASYTTPAASGRANGVGLRIASYSLDGGPSEPVSPISGNVTVTVVMNSAHSIVFSSVTQYQVSLDSGATGALSSVTAPTIPGDNYWYDSGTPVTLTLNGVYGRAGGTGTRLAGYSINGGSDNPTSTTSSIIILNNVPISSAEFVATTTVAQYQVSLGPGAVAALSSITFPTIRGDSYWYDSGSPVSVVLNGVYGRSSGSGFRISSYSLDGGAATSVSTTSTLEVYSTGSISEPHSVSATVETQYQITLDATAASALNTITPATISGDNYWYDAGSIVTLSLNGVWGRSQGVGNRLATYAINGGPNNLASTNQSVMMLNSLAISSPENVTATAVTQYQVSLDSGATGALSSVTAPTIPGDNYWYDSGTPVTLTLNGVYGRNSGTGTRITAYKVNAGSSIPISTAGTIVVLGGRAIVSSQSIATSTKSQYQLTDNDPPGSEVSLTPPTIPGDAGWYDSGTTVSVVLNNVVNATSTQRSNLLSYNVDSGVTKVTRSSSGHYSDMLTMSAPHSISAVYQLQYLLSVNGGGDVRTSPASPTEDSWFDHGTVLVASTDYSWNVTNGNTRLNLVSYAINGRTQLIARMDSGIFLTPRINMTEPTDLRFNAINQYFVSFSVTDRSGSTEIVPTELEITVNGSVRSISEGGMWFDNNSLIGVASVIWENSEVKPTIQNLTTITAPGTFPIRALVFPADLAVRDFLGFPVEGADVKVTFANGTLISGTTDSNGVLNFGLIPLGTFQAAVTSLGFTTQISGDATNHEVVRGNIVLSYPTLAVATTAVVLVIVFLLAIIARRSRIRKGGRGAKRKSTTPDRQSNLPRRRA